MKNILNNEVFKSGDQQELARGYIGILVKYLTPRNNMVFFSIEEKIDSKYAFSLLIIL